MADFIAPTSQCEGDNYLTLNTYDRAKFTFGFGQFTANVPGGDFVLFFRDMLALDYFPNLRVKSGSIVKTSAMGDVPLETSGLTRPLMDYLNPTAAHIEDDEVAAAAKLRTKDIVFVLRNRQVWAMALNVIDISIFRRVTATNHVAPGPPLQILAAYSANKFLSQPSHPRGFAGRSPRT